MAFLAIAIIPGVLVGFISAALGFGVGDWQFWALVIPTSMVTAFINATR
jgi:hypothetical protein